MKLILNENQQKTVIRQCQKAILCYKHDDGKRDYVKHAFMQLNNAKNGFMTCK